MFGDSLLLCCDFVATRVVVDVFTLLDLIAVGFVVVWVGFGVCGIAGCIVDVGATFCGCSTSPNISFIRRSISLFSASVGAFEVLVLLLVASSLRLTRATIPIKRKKIQKLPIFNCLRV